jgi:cellulose synthase/poly-beta-1,6-N-acetylglucosamine synthase-like glycosyltransferase
VVHISVVVPVHNGANQIGTCLEALAYQSVPQGTYEVIVVDDGSTDDTAQVVRRYPARLLAQGWRGAAAARNQGLFAAQGDLVLFTDADCEPAPDWIEQMCAPFDDSQVSGVKGVYRTRQKSLVARFVQLEYEDKYKRMARDQYIDFIDTYSAGYRCEVLRTAGGFDTSFPAASVEDQELSFRLAKAGHRLVFQPSAVVYHQHASTVAAYARKKFRIGYWKVLVHMRHPDKLLRDSHTPQILKLQILSLPLLVVSAVLALLWSSLGWLPVPVAALLFASMIPLGWQIWRTDPLVVLIAPWLLLVRAVSLGVGFAMGMVVQIGTRLFPFLIRGGLAERERNA